MKFGVSTASFYPLYTEQAVQNLIDNGIENIEIFLNTYSELTPKFIVPLKAQLKAQLQAGLKSSNINVVSVHPFTSLHETALFFSDYDRRFNDGIEQYKAYFNFMNEVSAKYFVFHGCLATSHFPDERYFERFAILAEVARSFGVIIAQENVAPYKSGQLDFLLKQKKYLGENAYFVLDIKQALRAKQDVFAMIEKLGSKIVHVHASDNITRVKSCETIKDCETIFDRETIFDCLPVGAGNFDFLRLFKLLEKFNFSGAIMLELYRSNYKEYEELYQSVRNLERIYSTSF